MAGWTPDEDQRLRDLWKQGLATALIGAQMGRGKNAIIGRAHRLQLTLRGNPTMRHASLPPKHEATRSYVRQPWKTAEAELRRMWNNGLSAAQIAGALGRTLGSVSARLSRLGLTSHERRRVVTPQPVAVVATPVPVIRAEPVKSVVVRLPVPACEFPTQRPAYQTKPFRQAETRVFPTVRTCQYPLTSGRPWRFCGEPAVPGTSWCAACRARCFVQKRQAHEVAA